MADEPNQIIVEKSGNGAMVAILALLVIALVAFGGYSLIQSQNHKDNAISTAADKVGDAAQDVGSAAQDAVKK